MARLIFASMLAMALFNVPANVVPQFSGQAQAETATKTEDEAKKAKKKAAKKAKKREQSEKQKAAADRRKRCAAEYQEAKKSGKLKKDRTWRNTWAKFWSECAARLKKAG